MFNDLHAQVPPKRVFFFFKYFKNQLINLPNPLHHCMKSYRLGTESYPASRAALRGFSGCTCAGHATGQGQPFPARSRRRLNIAPPKGGLSMGPFRLHNSESYGRSLI